MFKRPSTNYRSIYKKNFGEIPIDESGRIYDIHHIDGNSSNNDPSNLCAVSILEHYEIHKRQNNPKACNAIAARIKIDTEEHKRMCSLANTGENNPSYGSKWWTDGIVEIISKIKPEGDQWVAGRSQSMKDKIKLTKIENNTQPAGSKNGRYDHNIYKFYNTITCELLETTRFEFRKYTGIDKGYVRELINGTISVYKNWIKC